MGLSSSLTTIQPEIEKNSAEICVSSCDVITAALGPPGNQQSNWHLTSSVCASNELIQDA